MSTGGIISIGILVVLVVYIVMLYNNLVAIKHNVNKA